MVYKNRGPFQILESETVYKNKWITVHEDHVIRPGGSRGIFGVIEMVPGSSVLPLDKEGYVYLVKEYKYGIDKESIEVISGAIDKNESPLDAAKRELEEELGFTAHCWEALGYVDPFTTIVNSPNFLFLAREFKITSTNLDEGEKVIPIRVKFSEALEKVLKGEITHSASCVLILRAARVLGV